MVNFLQPRDCDAFLVISDTCRGTLITSENFEARFFSLNSGGRSENINPRNGVEFETTKSGGSKMVASKLMRWI